MLKDILNIVEEKYNNKKEENNKLNQLLQTTSPFQNLYPIPPLNIEESEYKIAFITNECPDINDKKATIISKLIPIEETYLDIFYAKELLTNQEYYITPTNKYLWIITPKYYGAFNYLNTKCSIIKNNLVSKIVLLNNTLLEINGNDMKIQNLINITNNQIEREKIIEEKTNYLCGITPTYQLINKEKSGISIDNNNNIVLHTDNKNYKHNTNEIINYEVLLDNQIYISKKSPQTSTIGSFKNNCSQINIRITLNDNTIINIPILKSNSIGTKYFYHDSIFKKNIDFATKIINKLNEITPKY